MPWSYSRRPTMYYSLLGLFSIIFSYQLGYAGEPIQGFRDLHFGMTPQEVAALDACSSSTDCMYELTEKNRYLTVTYLPEASPNPSESNNTSPLPRLAKIAIDMGQYTDEWHQQLQVILGNSYHLTQDFSEEQLQSFLKRKQDQLHTGYDDGQVVLTLVRRTFGNLVIRILYQNPPLANDFIQEMQASSTSMP